MEITIKIWEVDGYDIDHEHLDDITKQYSEHISEGIKHGYKSGELKTLNYPFDDKMYTGYWEITK